MIQNVRLRLNHGFQRLRRPGKVRYQRLYLAVPAALPDSLNRKRVHGRAAVGKIVSRHRGNHGIMEAHLHNRVGNA